jgi:hypothetical protein
MNLSYKHFVSVQPILKVETQVGLRTQDNSAVVPRLVNGYDGFGGVHDNLIWLQKVGKLIYTLHNKIIFESVKERSQGDEKSKLLDSAVRLSCLAVDSEHKWLAAGEGDVNSNGVAYIWIYDISNPEAPRRTSKLSNHHGGIQALAFAAKGTVLLSMSNYMENRWVCWDVSIGAVILADQAMDRDGLSPQNALVVSNPKTED